MTKWRNIKIKQGVKNYNMVSVLFKISEFSTIQQKVQTFSFKRRFKN